MRTNVVYQGDCIQGLKKLPDKSVDCIITDPPYEEKYMYLWDDLAKESERILKDGGSFITLVGHYQLLDVGNILSNHLRFWWIGSLIGKRSNRIFGKNVITKFKPILWFLKGKRKNTKYVPIDAIQVNAEKWNKKYHKWNQPIDYYLEFIKNLTDENDVICDPFMGSGTCIIACQELKRRWVGFEISPEYCKIIEKRLSQKAMTGFFDTQAHFTNGSFNKDLTGNSDEFPQILPLAELR